MNAKNIKQEPPKILIVDDISMNVEIMQNIIMAEGYEAYGAVSVNEAIDIMKETLPSLILTDLSMPEVDGLQFCRMLKSDPKTRDIPVIFISVSNSREEKEEAFLAGAIDFIPKPFDRGEVVMRVNNQLNAYRMKLEMEDYSKRLNKLVEEQKKQIEKEQRHVLEALAKVIARLSGDSDKESDNLSHNCMLLAQSLQFVQKYEEEITDEFIETIGVSSKLYNIGKVMYRSVKENTAVMTENDFAEQYSKQGVEILEEIGAGQKPSNFLSMALKIAECHNANWDGTGYPKLKGDEIPIAARITKLISDFNALVKGKENGGMCMEAKDAVIIMKEKSGSCYEPEMLDVFNRILRQVKIK